MDFGQAFEFNQTQSSHKTPKTYRLGSRNIREQTLLSEGAFGYIWKAVDTNTGQVFALKRVICTDSERANEAKQQLQLMRGLKSCPNLVGFYGGEVYRESNRTTVVVLMELCPNGTLLDEMIRRQSTGFNEDHLIRIVHSIATGLESLHSAGYAHRDVKLENVLIGTDSKYKLCDFGSCTNKTVDFGSMPKSEYGVCQQEIEKHTTPMYRPPEIADPFLRYRVNQKADVWMLGCVLYTLCYFAHPFVESNKLAISQALFKIPKNSKYSHKINDLIRHMLTPNPQNRPSITDILNITRTWNQLAAIPLNAEAKQLKAEREQQEKEMEKFDKKVVDFDGDIPLEQLMRLQAKVQNSKPDVKKPIASSKPISKPVNQFQNQPQQVKSTGNQGIRLTPQQNLQTSVPKTQSTNSNSIDFFNFSHQSSKPQQQQVEGKISNEDLWKQIGSNHPSNQTTNQTFQNTKTSDFDFFQFPTQKPQTKNLNSNQKNADLLDIGGQQNKKQPLNNDLFKFF